MQRQFISPVPEPLSLLLPPQEAGAITCLSQRVPPWLWASKNHSRNPKAVWNRKTQAV